MAILNLTAVEVHYAKEPLISLSVPHLHITQGERLAVVGPSGSGKTTLINVISGLEKPTGGKVCWDGVDISKLSAADRDNWRAKNVGLIMQDFHLYPGLNAKENILLPARFRRWRLPIALSTRADELLEQVGVANKRSGIENMSRGEIQRVAVARALLLSPPILIADEPTASLDLDSGQQVLQLLLTLTQQYNATLIVVTHDRRIAAQLSGRITLDNGQLIEPLERQGEQE